MLMAFISVCFLHSTCLRPPTCLFFPFTMRFPSRSPLFPYTTLFRSAYGNVAREDQYGDLSDTTDDRSVVRAFIGRSEEHTSELQSPYELVCRLLLEKKNSDIVCRLLLEKKKKTNKNRAR